jgi:starvation-inducible DNA-binding protein
MIAERVLTLGGTPLHTFEDYIKNNELAVGKNVSVDVEAINLIVRFFISFTQMERKKFKCIRRYK